MAKKKGPRIPNPMVTYEPPVPTLGEFTLADLLANFGRSKLVVGALFVTIGIHNAAEAYAFLRSQDRIPFELTQEKFDKIYAELMA